MTSATIPHMETLTSMRELFQSQRDQWQRASHIPLDTKQAAVLYYQKRIDAIDYAFEVIATAPAKRLRLGSIINKTV